jgi:hypothetical protein
MVEAFKFLVNVVLYAVTDMWSGEWWRIALIPAACGCIWGMVTMECIFMWPLLYPQYPGLAYIPGPLCVIGLIVRLYFVEGSPVRWGTK